MKRTEVTMARDYLHEVKARLEELLQYPRDESKRRGEAFFAVSPGLATPVEFIPRSTQY